MDGKSLRGPWGNFCVDCWEAEGCGQLGTGYGQRLVTSQKEYDRMKEEERKEQQPLCEYELDFICCECEHEWKAFPTVEMQCPKCNGYDTIPTCLEF